MECEVFHKEAELMQRLQVTVDVNPVSQAILISRRTVTVQCSHAEKSRVVFYCAEWVA